MIDYLGQYKVFKENLEINKNRSIITSNILNKNFLVIGENIEEISIANKILTPETLSIYINTLLEEIVYLGDDLRFDASIIKENDNAFSRDVSLSKREYGKLPLESIFSELSCIINGTYYNSRFSLTERDKVEKYIGKYKRSLINILRKENIFQNINVKKFFNILNSNHSKQENRFCKLKDILPGLLLITQALEKELLKIDFTQFSDFYDQQIFLRVVFSKLNHYLIDFLFDFNKNLKQLLQIQSVNNNIFFNINNLKSIKNDSDYPIDLLMLNYIKFIQETDTDIVSKKEHFLNDISINVLNSNNNILVIEEAIERYININNSQIKNIIIFDKFSLDYKSIFKKYSSDKVNFIFDGEEINYTYLSSENVLLHSLKNQVNLNKGIKSSTVYTSKQTIDNNDTLNINNIFLFNIAKNIFYSKSLKQEINNEIDFKYIKREHWLTNNKEVENKIYKEIPQKHYLDKKDIEEIEKNETLKSELILISKYIDEDNIKINKEITKNILFKDNISKLEDTRKKVYDNVKIDLSIIGLKIDNKNDVLSLANISDNYKYMQLMFKTIEGDFNQIIDYDFSWYLNNSEDSKTKKDFLNIVLKEYRKNIKFLSTIRGSAYNTQEKYFNLKTEYNESISNMKNSLKNETINFLSFIYNSNLLLNNKNYDNYLYKELPDKSFLDTKELDFIVEETFNNIFKELISKFNLKDNKILYFRDGENEKFILEELFQKSLYKVLINNLSNLEKTNKIFQNNEFSKKYFENNDYNEKIHNYLEEKKLFKLNTPTDIYYTFSDKTPFDMRNLLKIKRFSEILSNWFEVNYNLDRFTPIKEIISDIERVINGENYMNVKEEVFIKLQENRKKILTDSDFLKMKESYGFYLFDKQIEVFKLKNGCSREDLENNKDCIIPDDKEKLFSEITGIGKYYSDNLKLNSEEQRVLNSLEGGYFDYFKENELLKSGYSNFLKQFNFNEDLLKKEVLQNDKNNLLYYYYHLYRDIQNKINDGVLDINKSSKILNEIPLLFFKKFSKNESFEKTYYAQKGRIASFLDEKYLIFKKSDQKIIQKFLHDVQVSKFLNNDYKDLLYKSTSYLIEILNENIGDLILENIINRQKRTSMDKDFYLYQILRVYINNYKGLAQDNLINNLYNSSCVNTKMNVDIFFKKTNTVLRNITPIVKEMTEIRNNYKEITKIPYDMLETINNKLKSIVNVIEFEFNDFGELNYSKIQKELNNNFVESGVEKEDTLYGSFEKMFEMQFVQTAKLEDKKEFHSFFISIPGYINPVVENIMKNLVEKYKVAILVFSPNQNNELDLRKVYTSFENNLTSDKKYKFNIANIVYTNNQVINYDKDLLDIDFPGSFKQTKIKQFDF